MACGFPILHLGLCLCTRNRISTCPLCWDGWASTRRIINWNSPINVLDGRLGLRLHLFRARWHGNIGRRIWLNVLVVESHPSYDAVSAWRKVPSMQGSHQCSNRWYQKGIYQKEISKGNIIFHGAVASWSGPFHERIASMLKSMISKRGYLFSRGCGILKCSLPWKDRINAQIDNLAKAQIDDLEKGIS